MTHQDFSQLVKKDTYQVFLFFSRANLPFSFGAHAWFIINKKGIISRWEVLFNKRKGVERWGHLYKNCLPPTEGLSLFPFIRIKPWRSHLIGFNEGRENSLAFRMIEYIENSPVNYPYYEAYFLSGPNSNTYIQWVLNKFPESKLFLPGNAFGKSYLKESQSFDRI